MFDSAALRAPLALAVALAGTTTVKAAQIEEVVVTASHRQQSVQDIPYNITAMTSADLENAGITDIAKLAQQVPGMVWNDMGARSNGVNNPIVLRGLNGTSAGSNSKSPGAGDQTVSVYLNETPLYANLRLKDIERVEVLRGPQGTLYGAGSVGGTVRFIYKKPEFDEFYGSIDTKIGQSKDADDMDYAADGVANIPLTETLALRVGAGYEYNAGVIDATNLMQMDENGAPVLADPTDYFGSDALYYGEKDVDESDVYYVRGSLLWEPTDSVSVLLSAHVQEDSAEDFSGQSLNGNEREHTRFGKSPIDIKNNVYSAEVSVDLGFATLTSASSYTDTEMVSDTDNTNYGIGAAAWYAGNPRPSYKDGIDYDTDRFTQEFRLASNSEGGLFDWVVGAYYSDYQQKSHIESEFAGWAELANTPGHPTAVAELGDPNATWAQYYQTLYPDAVFNDDIVYYLDKDITYENTSIFGELTTHLTDAWQVTLGARAFWVENDRVSDQSVPFGGVAFDFYAQNTDEDNDMIFKLNTSYDISDSTMVYFTWAEGYRQGGSNAIPVTGPFGAPEEFVPYDPDYATNWEVGAKGQISDKFSYVAALYYIDWESIQVQVPAPASGIPTIANGGDAVSQGMELELKAYLTDNFDAVLGYTYTDAELTEDSLIRSGFNGYDGDKLPGVPEHSVTLSMNYVQPLDMGEIRWHLDGSYRSETQTALNSEARNYWEVDGFDMWNASVTWNYDRYRVGAFVDNITDELGVTSVDLSSETTPPSRPGSLMYVQDPRTIGLTFGLTF